MQETVVFGFAPWRHPSRTGTGAHGAAPPAFASALSLAGIHEVFALRCPKYGGHGAC